MAQHFVGICGKKKDGTRYCEMEKKVVEHTGQTFWVCKRCGRMPMKQPKQ